MNGEYVTSVDLSEFAILWSGDTLYEPVRPSPRSGGEHELLWLGGPYNWKQYELAIQVRLPLMVGQVGEIWQLSIYGLDWLYEPYNQNLYKLAITIDMPRTVFEYTGQTWHLLSTIQLGELCSIIELVENGRLLIRATEKRP